MTVSTTTKPKYKAMEYLVTWNIEIDAESFEDAALIALDIQRDPESIATFFQVKNNSGETRELSISVKPREKEEDPTQEKGGT